jgi:hypothetical protein
MWDEREGSSRYPWVLPARSDSWRTLRRRADRERREPPTQVFNAEHPTAVLKPVSDVPAATVRAGWEATLPGQTVPLIWERTDSDG